MSTLDVVAEVLREVAPRALKLRDAPVCAAVDRTRKDHLLAGAPIDTARIVDALVRRTHAAEVLS